MPGYIRGHSLINSILNIFKNLISSNISLSTLVCIFVYKNILFATKSVGHISKIAKAKTAFFYFMRHCLISFQEVAMGIYGNGNVYLLKGPSSLHAQVTFQYCQTGGQRAGLTTTAV